MNTFKDLISVKKRGISLLVDLPLAQLAEACLEQWHAPEQLDLLLQQHLALLPTCSRLYVVTRNGKQHSATVMSTRIDTVARGRDLSGDATLAGALPFRGMCLTEPFLSREDLGPCIAAIQAVSHGEELLGFVVADFSIQASQVEAEQGCIPRAWRQFKGDPAIRGTVFQQQRAFSLMDEYMDATVAVIRDLVRGHGIFHVKLHFSSSRATFWCVNDPYNYRLHSVEEFIDSNMCLAYPCQSYPTEAVVSETDVDVALSYFKVLRLADENLYLRSASLNIMNGMIGLTFSCDGTHYMSVSEFLQKDIAFWLGSGNLLSTDRAVS